MDQQDVDAIEARPQQGLLDRPHRSVETIVEPRAVREAARETRRHDVGARRGDGRKRVHAAPDLGREQEGVAWDVAQACPAARFGESVAVMRRRIEDPDACPISIGNGGRRLHFAELAEEVAQRRRAEAEGVKASSRPERVVKRLVCTVASLSSPVRRLNA